MTYRKQDIEETLKFYTLEQAMKTLCIDRKTLNKYASMYSIKIMDKKVKESERNIINITNLNTQFYNEHGFYPDVVIISKRLKISEQAVRDIMGFYDCREVHDVEFFYDRDVSMHGDFMDMILLKAKKDKVTFEQAFQSFTYNYMKGTFKRI